MVILYFFVLLTREFLDISHRIFGFCRDFEKDDAEIIDKNIYEGQSENPLCPLGYSTNEELPPGWERHQGEY